VSVVPIVLGAVLVLLALRDVLHTLLHPGGTGSLSPRVFRAVWALGRRVPPVGRLAGPLGMVATGLLWWLMVLGGFALAYTPYLPEGFVASQGVPLGGSPLEALYVSAIALSTLGLGDVVPTEGVPRALMALEAFVGFGLLTAYVTWWLSIYPTLLRRRALAARLHVLLDDGEPLDDRELHDLAEQLAVVRVDLVQYPASAFFRAPDRRLSLAAVLPELHEALPRGRARRALEELARQVGAGHVPLEGDEPGELLRAHAEAYGR
jgi:hypothetical protein